MIFISMPQIPQGTHRPSFGETIVDLLESIALEEIAISHILNAQGEKLQALIQQYSACSLSPEQMHQGCHATQEMIHTLIMKEWLLCTKLKSVMELQDKHPTPKKSPCSDYLPNATAATQTCESCLHRPICHPCGQW